MKVVAAGRSVEINRARIAQIPVVGPDGAPALLDRLCIVPAQDIDMSCYMLDVASVRHQPTHHVRATQSPLGKRRHLHQMDIHMQDSGMTDPCFLDLCDRCLQNDDSFLGQGIRVWSACLEIPQLSRRTGYCRF